MNFNHLSVAQLHDLLLMTAREGAGLDARTRLDHARADRDRLPAQG